MRKLTAFGLGTLAGAIGVCCIMNNNAKEGETLYENDEMIIKEAGSRFRNANTAVVKYKNKEEA